MSDPAVTKPAHYTFSRIEVYDAIEAWQLNHARGSIVKYMVRAGRKNPATELQDLKKALWYLNREIARLQTEEAEMQQALGMQQSRHKEQQP